MRRETLWRLAGVAAVVGGLVDLTGPLIYPHLTEPARQMVYVLIDLLLLFGLLGLQSAAGRVLGWPGLAGFVVAVTAVLLVRSSATNLLGPQSYMIAASLWSIAMAVIAVAVLRARAPFRTSAILWIAALVIGLVGLALKDQGLLHRLAASSFALASVALGVDLIRQAKASTGDDA
ncbi:hypothetical protein [Caulobacter sp. B11]|uniref:hypothetical protein n=1 Tax=Caulobacter sp. B11 TaxID=2048899 RepID=UPI00191BA096|nr:hypothetical protein [Caulobacter sp. B11]